MHLCRRGSGEAKAAPRDFRRALASDRVREALLTKLVCAAPESFLSFAEASQVAFASASHFFRKLVLAAPASFFSADSAAQLGQ